MSLIDPSSIYQIADNLGYGANAPIAIGMANQESGMGAASSNLYQITPSTAAQPGYGMAPISAADIADPTKNATFALTLAARKLQAQGLDPSDPKNAQLLAQAQNGFGRGAGDPNYYSHVMNRMAYAPALGGTGTPGAAPPPSPSQGPFSGSPSPAMPASFGAPTQPDVQAPQISQRSTAADPLVALGLGLASGNGFHDSVGKAGAAYEQAQDQVQQNQRANAELQGQTNELNAEAPGRAAQAAASRAEAWRTLNPTLTPDQADALNVQVRGQDIQHEQAMAELAQNATFRQMMFGANKGQPQALIVPGPDGSPARTIMQENSPSGVRYVDTKTGQAATNLHDLGADDAVPQSAWNSDEQRTQAIVKPNLTESTKLITAGTAADAQKQQLAATFAAANQPGALAGPGLYNSVGRWFDQLTGTSTFGSLNSEQQAKLQSGQGNWSAIRNSIPPGSRLTNNDVNLLQQVYPNLGTSSQARSAAQSIMSNALDRSSFVTSKWSALSDPERTAILRTPSGVAQFENQQTQAWDATHVVDGRTGTIVNPLAQPQQPQGAPQQPQAAPAAAPVVPQAPQPAARPPLSSFHS